MLRDSISLPTAATNLGSHGFRLNQNPKHPFCSKQKCGKKNNCWSLWQQLKNKRIDNQRKNLWNENKDHFSKNMTFLGFFVFFCNMSITTYRKFATRDWCKKNATHISKCHFRTIEGTTICWYISESLGSDNSKNGLIIENIPKNGKEI